MCDEGSGPDEAIGALPRRIEGSAVDPILLEPVDQIVITILVDNVYDGLLANRDNVRRAPVTAGTAEAPQFESGSTPVGLAAEHGFSALIAVRRGDKTTSLLSTPVCRPTR